MKAESHFTKLQIQALAEGFDEIFKELDIRVDVDVVETSKRSVSLYIKFNDRIARTVRLSTHKPNYSQKDYINIY